MSKTVILLQLFKSKYLTVDRRYRSVVSTEFVN